jgi:hypothetical protein
MYARVRRQERRSPPMAQAGVFEQVRLFIYSALQLVRTLREARACSLKRAFER